MTDVDMFADLDDVSLDEDTEANSSSEADNTTSGSDVSDTPNGESSDSAPATEDKPVETVSSIPQGAVSVTEFAQWITQELIKAKMLAGEELDGTEYTVPQEVYQTVKAQKDRIPHVLVKRDEESEARVYILKEQAFPWWMNRREKNKDRGAGAKSASNRSPEDNLNLLTAAVAKHLYAQSRQKMWNERVDRTENLVKKYRGFLSDASVDSDTVELAIQEATDIFNAEQAKKEENRKAAKAAKKTETAPETVNA